jgi:predicted HicB family RNase H-like nuclease
MMKLAHEKDITLNQLVEEALVQVVDKVKEKQVL